MQDIIKRESRTVGRLIEDGASIYVCGSSGAMPKAVREAILYAIQESTQKWDREQAEEILRRLEGEKKYIQETW